LTSGSPESDRFFGGAVTGGLALVEWQNLALGTRPMAGKGIEKQKR